VIADELTIHRAVLQRLVEERNASQQGAQVNDLLGHINSTIDAAADSSEIFSWLKSDPAQRQGFFDFLVNVVNPTPDQLTPEFIGKMALAYNDKPTLEMIRGLQQRDRADKAKKLRNSAGGSGSVRGGAVPQKQKAEGLLEEMISERLGR
jgi:hypothetical protein